MLLLCVVESVNGVQELVAPKAFPGVRLEVPPKFSPLQAAAQWLVAQGFSQTEFSHFTDYNDQLGDGTQILLMRLRRNPPTHWQRSNIPQVIRATAANRDRLPLLRLLQFLAGLGGDAVSVRVEDRDDSGLLPN
jgi:hypothetical protein